MSVGDNVTILLVLAALAAAYLRLPRSIGVRSPRPQSTSTSGALVLVLTADVGEGHLSAARALEAGLVREGSDVVVVDALGRCPRVLRFILRDAYRAQLRWCPWAFGVVYWAFLHLPPLRAIGRAVLVVIGGRALRRLAHEHDADVIVSTYPFFTSVLGDLRLHGDIDCPVVATITDLSGVGLWAHPGVDLHLVMHPVCAPEVERVAGVDSVAVVQPLVAPAYYEPRACGAARSAQGLPHDRSIVLVSGGGWGIGDLEGAVRIAAAADATHVICVTGQNQGLRDRLAERYRARDDVAILGFTCEMNDLIAAADVLVHSTGGVTCLEALVRGTPVVTFGSPPGHAPMMNRVLAALGLVRNAETEDALRVAIRAALADTADPGQVLRGAANSTTLARTATARIAAPTRARRTGRRVGAAAIVAGVLAMSLGMTVEGAKAVDHRAIEPISDVLHDVDSRPARQPPG